MSLLGLSARVRSSIAPNLPRSRRPSTTLMELAPGFLSLARRAQAGDSAALNALLGELRPLIMQTTRLTVGSGSWAAEDAA